MLGGVVYAVIAANGDDVSSDEVALRIAEDLVARAGHQGTSLFGIGGHAGRLHDIPRSKREAEEALRVLRSDPKRSVATIDQVRLPALLARFSESAAAESDVYEHKIAPLLESDRSGGTAYIEALGAYFAAFGDYTAAAASLHIHPNTLRYRLRKAQEIGGVRLDDPEERLALMLLLRVLPTP